MEKNRTAYSASDINEYLGVPNISKIANPEYPFDYLTPRGLLDRGRAVNFDINNVSMWMHANGYDYESLLPPKPYKANAPYDRIVFEWRQYDLENDSIRLAAECHTLDLDSLDDEVRSKSSDDVYSPVIVEDARWISEMHLYLKGVYLGTILNQLDQMGHIIEDESYCDIGEGLAELMGAISKSDGYETDPEQQEFILRIFTDIPFVALVLLNIKNIEIETRPVSRQRRRQAERKGHQVIEYRELNIRPFASMPSRRSGGPGGRVGNVRKHLCRGSWATYGGNNLLFGKYDGTFWRPAHAKGNPERGEIMKDYTVEAEAGEE